MVDSGSTDGTVEIAQRHPRTRVVSIPPAEFNHGMTRNLGPRHCRGEFLAYTVADARPADERWLERLWEPMRENAAVMAVCGQQIVEHSPETNPAEWFRPVDPPRRRILRADSTAAYEALPPGEKRALCSWDDVTVLYRRRALEEIPFRPTVYAEDAQWARDALLRGWTLAVEPAAQVYHFHLADPRFTEERTLTTLYHRYRLFGTGAGRPPWLVPGLRATRTVLKSRGLGLAEKWKWIRYNWANLRAHRRAAERFERARQDGAEAVERLHDELKGRPPVPLKGKAP